MPHSALQLRPGVDVNRTITDNQGAISISNLIRFVPDSATGTGIVQKLGGWTKFFPIAINDPIRVMWPWQDLRAVARLAVGTETTLQLITDSNLTNITPQVYDINLSVSFTTTAGSPNVYVTDVGSNINDKNQVFIQTPVSVGGIVLQGLYQTYSNSPDDYYIIARDILGAPVNAVSNVANGGAVPSFTTTLASNTIAVTLNNHGLAVGSTFTVLVPTVVGGVSLYGDYIVISVTSGNAFKILAGSVATSVVTVSENGGQARLKYFIGSGLLPTSTGYGIGGYGAGGYGTGVGLAVGRTATTTAVSAVGTTATVTFNRDLYVPPGSAITITGVTPTGFNGSWIVTAATRGATSTVSFITPTALSGPQTVAGTITIDKWYFPPDGDLDLDDWCLDNWGEDLIACRQDGPIFDWSPSSGSSYAELLPNSPIINAGAFVSMPQRQIVAYGSSFTGIQDPLLVRWCDISNFSSWIGTPTNQAGSYRIPKGSKIIGGIQAPQQGLIWTDVDLWAMQYIGLPYVYSFNEVGTGCGLVDHKAVAVLSEKVYWMSQSQFFVYEGGAVRPLLCPVWDVVFQNIDASNYQAIRAGANSRFNEVTWYFPTIGSNGHPTKYVKYNTILDCWDYGDLTRTAWVDQSVLGAPLGSDDLGYIYQHETSSDADGQPITASFQTGYFALDEGDMLMFVDQVWMDMKWGYFGAASSANVSITFYVANYPGETPKVHGPFNVTQASTYITPRFRGRLVSVRISSSDVGSFWRLGRVRYRVQADGKSP